MEGTVKTTETSASAETVFDVAADLPSYPDWASGVSSVEVLEETEDGLARRAEFEVEGFIKKIRYTLVYEYERPSKISWTAEPGADIEEMEGHYEFNELDDGGTEIVYALAVTPAFVVPGFLRRQAERQIVGSALRGLKKVAEEREAG
ncbi:MAG: SRPBCC family protein [Acidimicrobiia bacterium]|nr:SRPBCC family protein [Acidimicrobiia bacterium]